MNNRVKFKDLQKNNATEMYLMVTELVQKTTSGNSDPFVTVSLSDGERTRNVNFFKETIESLNKKGLTEYAILKITLKEGNNGFLNQSSWEVNTDPSITPEDFAHRAPIDPDFVFDWLVQKIREVASNKECVGPYKSISDLTVKLLQDNKEAFKCSSAAVSMHHNFLAGLLYHTARMASAADQLCKVYTSLDMELLMCAVALHDIGKIKCYVTSAYGDASITVDGRLLDHSLSGVLMIHEAAKLDKYDPEKVQMLEHMLASHHGRKEWDAITTPAFPEAMVLHSIDYIDSRINMFEEAYKLQEPGTLSDTKVFGLDNSYIYKPLYNQKWDNLPA